MSVPRMQQTIAHPCHVSGRGYWSGKAISLMLLPAEANTGIQFQRVDLPDTPCVAALAGNREETPLRTRLVNDNCAVEMVEHVMAALHGLQIDNCVVQCNSHEMPAMDGSALGYALAIEQAGVQKQTIPCRRVVIEEPLRIGGQDQWIMAMPCGSDGLFCEYRLDYGPQSTIPGGTFQTQITPDTFMSHIAPARTFVTSQEAEFLQMQGLAGHVTHRDLLVFGPNGPIDNSLRFDNECVRHKLLDLVGDLALSGVEIHGRLVAYRSGHALNGRMAELLSRQSLKEYKQDFHCAARAA